MRRYETEQKREKGIQYVQKTDNWPSTPPFVPLPEIKDMLLKRIAVPIRESLEVSKAREDLLKIDKSDPNF